MAGVADADDHGLLDGAGLDHVTASAADFRFRIFRMDVSFHKRDENLPAIRLLTSANLAAVRSISKQDKPFWMVGEEEDAD